jgi:nifR3 family TIM-barrel protein
MGSWQAQGYNSGMMATKPIFSVGPVPIYGDTILAPMAHFSDVPFRGVCRAFGSAMNYTEFVPANALLQQPNPMWRRLDGKLGGERPLVFQIFGADTQELVAAAVRIAAWGPDIIDINMGCSVPQISEQGAGVGLMRQPAQVAQLFRQLSAQLPIPVTGKIRLGWDDESRNYLQIARVMEENGAALIAVHGRTKTQKYSGEADWEAIARLKQSVSVPIIGNGDIRTVADIERMKAYTGCDAVMIGRAAVGNPWLFARQERELLTFPQITAVARTHLQEMLTYYGNPEGLVRFRPHWRQYCAGLALKRFVQPMLVTEDVAHFLALLAELETAVPADELLVTLQNRTWFAQPPLFRTPTLC